MKLFAHTKAPDIFTEVETLLSVLRKNGTTLGGVSIRKDVVGFMNQPYFESFYDNATLGFDRVEFARFTQMAVQFDNYNPRVNDLDDREGALEQVSSQLASVYIAWKSEVRKPAEVQHYEVRSFMEA